MLRHPDYTRDRIQQLVERLGQKIYAERLPFSNLEVCGPTERISYEQAQQLSEFHPARIGDQFRPLWATYWFRVEARIPESWKGARVDVLWDSQSEATLWLGGKTTQGLNMTQGPRPDAILLDHCKGGENLDFQIEMACNTKFGAPVRGSGDVEGDPISPFHLRRAEVARFDPAAWELYWDAYVLSKLEVEISTEGATGDLSWAGLLLSELNHFCNVIDLDDSSTWSAAREVLKKLYQNKNATRTFELTAIGHAHIDTAWLWPLAETWRKCERTFSTATAYMRDYPEYRFACSQAYQYETIKTRNPDLYARIQKCVDSGQWIPVGGTWIEPDCNIPSGEALCRQFLFGQRFFEKEFGKRCNEFWNPDVFGYNGQLPQIMRLSGVEYFLTQKLSWNRFNKPHHHSFLWRGIDGTEVLTHFPPADGYNAMETVGGEIEWIRRNALNYRDHDRSHEGLMMYGFGDGGGGPTKAMLEILRRAEDLQGLPRTAQRTSAEFFARLEADLTDRPTLVGELYFELHRGTYTSQALIKKNNRRAEQLLHDLEFLAAARGEEYSEELRALWKIVLLNQFHDILPGSSIEFVYDDSAKQFEEVFARGEKLLREYSGEGDVPLNTTPFARAEVIEQNGELVFVSAAPFANGAIATTEDEVRLAHKGDEIVLENQFLRAAFNRGGRLTSLVEKASGRESLEGEANIFEIYDDHPTNYDAWDVDPFHLETGKACESATHFEIVTQNPLRAEVRFEFSIGAASKLGQTVRLDASSRQLEFHCRADWNEAHKFLKVAFPVAVHASDATYEMQFGYAVRPTHYSTPYDLARYEVPMHRWFDLSEHGFGISILNDCKYGGSTFGNVMRLSLLRAPKSPDPHCDIGTHEFSYALLPHQSGWREAGIVAHAARYNAPLRRSSGVHLSTPFATTDDANLVLDTIKPAEDSDSIVLRFYEAHGAGGRARVKTSHPFKRAVYCNVLEDEAEMVEREGDELLIAYRPHQIIGVKLS
jgi:alpha-mannosidase